MSSFDQVIRNILADIFAEEEQQEVTRTKARPEGLMSNNKPQNTQEDAEPVQPSASKSTSDFVKAMADYDDTPEEGVEIPLAFFKGTARDIEGRYKATGMQLVKANRDRVNDRIKVPTIEKDPKEEYADDLMAHLNALGIIKTGKKDFIPSTRDIQIMLSDRGYNVGTIDGIMGNKTEAAIRAFQKDVGFTGKDVDGNFGRKTFEAFMNTTPSSSPISQEELEPAPMNFSGTKTQREKIQDILDRDDFIKRDPGFELSTPTITVSSNIKKTKEEKENVQRALLELGYDVGEVDGVIGTKTRAAIRQFQKDNNLSADAVVGKNTAAAMNEALSQASPVQEGRVEVIQAGFLPNLTIPSHVKMFAQDLLGYDLETARTEDFFSDAEKDVIKALVVNSSKRLKNKNKGYVEYGNKKNPKDYSIGIEDVTWDSSNVDSLSFSDAEGAIKKTLGQFNWYVDENDDLIVVDRYNFNDAEELQKKYPNNSDKLKHLTQLAGSVVTGETSAFGWLRRLGGLYGSVEGEGAEFKINLGKLEL